MWLTKVLKCFAHLMMVTNWVIVSSWGTRNFVLSRGGKYFSLWYRSIITWNKHQLTQTTSNRWTTHRNGLFPTGILVGNLVLIPATSCFLVADSRSIFKKKSKTTFKFDSLSTDHLMFVWYKDTYLNSSSVWKVWDVVFSQMEACWVAPLTCVLITGDAH